VDVDQNFLREVFSKQPGQIMGFSRKLKGRWSDRFFTHLSDAIDWIKEQPSGADIYFCPTKLSGKRRIKSNVLRSKFLYSDLDEIDPTKISKAYRPSHAWESSPGRYQCLWELDRAANPEDVEKGNKALAYQLGADRGGWDLTQVLRVPGTFNNKYPDQPRVKVLWVDPSQSRSLDSYPDTVDDGKSSASSRGAKADALVLVQKELQRLLRRYSSKLPRKAISLLKARRAEVGKRSDILWYLSHALIDAGLTRDAAFKLIRASVWNKYRGRADEVKRLTHELKEAEKAKGDEGEEEDRLYKSELKVISHADLMISPATSPGWLVEKFWTRESHGIIAGEPKSFKSTLLLDFVVSVASGEPFMNEFAVAESGPVLMVQNENSDWIMTDRLQKIMTNRRVMGRVKNVKDGIIFTAPLDLPIYYINQQGFSFSDPDHIELVERFIDEARPVAVMFDPLYLMFDGDVNSAKDLGPALNWLLYLKQTYQTSVMLVHHWNKSGQSKRGGQRMLGSTTLHGWVESAWYLSVNSTPKEDEEDKTDDMHKRAESISLTLEREFRGAGTYPKLDLTISMGDFGDTSYDIGLEKHLGAGRPKKDRQNLSADVTGVLELSARPMSIRALAKEIGVGRRPIQEVIDILLEEKTIIKQRNGYKVRSSG